MALNLTAGRLWYLLSVERPAVAMREDEPTKTKSWAVLLWHCNVWQRETQTTVSGCDSNRKTGGEFTKMRMTGRK